MSDIAVNNRGMRVEQVRRVNQGNDMASYKANDANDIVFTIGNDMFIASGRGLDVSGITPGTPIQFDGRYGSVVTVDEESRGFGTVLKLGFNRGAITSAATAIIGAGVVAGTAVAAALISRNPRAVAGFLKQKAHILGGTLVGATIVTGSVAMGREMLEKSKTKETIRQEVDVNGQRTRGQ